MDYSDLVIEIDKKRDKLLEDYSVGMLKDFYLTDYEKSPQEGFARASLAWSTYNDKLDVELAQRLYDYVSNKWFMFASPVLSNEMDKTRKIKVAKIYLVFLLTYQIHLKV